MDETGFIHKKPDIERMREELWTISIDDEETRSTIKEAWQEHELLLEPHGAVGWTGLKHFMEENKNQGLMVSVETAHPAKFPEEIERLLHFVPETPESISLIEQKKEHYTDIPNDYEIFRNLVMKEYSNQ
jgi:threonine synthase